MARVGRAARNASLMRVENISSDKVCQAAESGEVYIASGGLTVTLPPAKAGAYIKVILGAQENNSGTALVVQTASTSTTMVGSVDVVTEGTEPSSTYLTANRAAAGDGHDKVTMNPAGGHMYPGTFVECICDGTSWYVNGTLFGASSGNTAQFGDQ